MPPLLKEYALPPPASQSTENVGLRRQNDSCPSWPDLAVIQLTEISGIFSIRYAQSWTNLLGTLLRLIGLVEEEVGSQLLVLVAGEVGLDD